ncbi:DUF7289 family protein [Halorussus amylolyticus]|uniref:DUF7289 family protein n=1 Tax=Halorussus amylolyticus TaxID=1126242 RepID=UPI001EE401F2|nr:hypothetical protein [Halorussus amylolyticus]
MSRDSRSDVPSARRTRVSRRLCRSEARRRLSDARAQSNVVGVALLLGIVVVSLGSLTAGIGTVVEENAATADANRVAADFDAALEPVEATGVHREQVSFTEGEVRTVERNLRVLNDSGVVRTVGVDALVFSAGDRRVTFLAGAVVRGTETGGQMRTPPPITASRSGGDDGEDDEGVLVVGAPKLNGSASVSATGGGSFRLRTNVTHERERLGNDTFRVAIETANPDAWRRQFESMNATVTTERFDGDDERSVVARFPGERVGYVVVHDMRLGVAHG